MVLDYRALNKITIKRRYPMPNIQELFDKLQGAKIFSSLDLQSGYYQIKITEEDRPKTAFLTPVGQFQFKVLCCGLTNAPATFQSVMNQIFKKQIEQGFVVVYLDDILVFSKTPDEHLKHLEEVLTVLQREHLRAKLKKCHFNQSEVKFLGHIVGREGLKVDPAKVQIINDWPVPNNLHEVRKLLGLSNYFRRFIQGYSKLVAPLTDLTRGGKSFEWTPECQHALEGIKHALTHAPVLQLPDQAKPYTIWSDASITGCGAVLFQDEHPVAYMSRKFTPAEVNYTTNH
jgi:Reverse transcriptase (RNA-dependent DNA polymerase)/RNase H-like domain found in reverse transcriptase